HEIDRELGFCGGGAGRAELDADVGRGARDRREIREVLWIKELGGQVVEARLGLLRGEETGDREGDDGGVLQVGVEGEDAVGCEGLDAGEGGLECFSSGGGIGGG